MGRRRDDANHCRRDRTDAGLICHVFGNRPQAGSATRYPGPQGADVIEVALSGAAKWSPCRLIAVKSANHAAARVAAIRGDPMAYKMTAERDTETVKSERTSLIIAVAKARVFASEGWQVTITTDDGKVFAPAAFDTLLAA
jgi:hypothetical protein